MKMIHLKWTRQQKDGRVWVNHHTMAGSLYPSGEFMFKVDHPHWGGGENSEIEISVTWNGRFDEFLSVMSWIASKPQTATIKAVCLPYFPQARQDKITRGGDEAHSKSFMEWIVSRTCSIQKVYVYDIHSHAEDRTAFINLDIYQLINFHLDFDCRPNAVIAPDNGARDRAQGVASNMNKRFVLGTKERDPRTGKLSNYKIGDEYNSIIENAEHLLVVDDICDGGGTFLLLADAIRKRGYTGKLDLFVTHGLFTKGLTLLLENYDHVYTTDSCDSALTYLGVPNYKVKFVTQNMLGRSV
jgi:ribose-phosphate pyrophosphokinase